MKQHLICLLAIILFPFGLQAGQTFYTVFDAGVSRLPVTNSAPMVTLPAGSQVEVIALDRTNYWARIVLPEGRIGYVDLGCLDFPGGQTVTVTETFDADEVAASEKSHTNTLTVLFAIVFFLILAAGLAHMLYMRAEVDNEPRIFVGSVPRIVLFALLMVVGIFMAEGFWLILLNILGTFITVAFSYYAYLRPKSKLLVGGAPSKNAFQILGGMWTELENRQVDKVRVGMLRKRIEELNNEIHSTSSAQRKEELEREVSSLEAEKREEETKLNEKIALTFVSVLIGVLFVWLTPFVAIVQYARNYPLYLHKRDKYQRKAGMLRQAD